MRLIDADALIEYCNNQKDKTISANDIARFPAIGGWISVKDRLPDQYGEYLAVVSGEVMEVTFCKPIRYYKDGRKWSTCNADGFEWLNDGDVTYWMPRPEPPKEE